MDDTTPPGGSPTELSLNEASHGFGLLLPHTVLSPGSTEIVSIRSIADISANVFRGNPILPTASLPDEAIVANGTPGNHYLFANFTTALDPLTVLSAASGGNGLEGAVTMTTIDSTNSVISDVPGRAFVGGATLVLEGGQEVLQTWATFNPTTGMLEPNPAIPEAQGFPGVGSEVANVEALVSPNTILFVADDDADLATLDTFPSGVTIRFRASTALVAASGEALQEQVLAVTTVGQDLQTPEISLTPPPAEMPMITPGNGDVDVQPDTTVRMEFTESVQPYSLGELEGQGPALLSSAVSLVFGPATSPVFVPVNVRPVSPFDLSVYEVVPGFAFPGSGPSSSGDSFSTVDVELIAGQVEDLSSRPSGTGGQTNVPNFNTRGANTFFETAEGVGIVNTPVAPDVIFVGRSGANAGLSVVDLNGFGQSTGNPVSSMPFPLEGESRFPYDLNVTLNPGIRPILSVGTSTVDGGSAGVFTLTLDSHLNSLVAAAPSLSSAGDMHFAHALDGVFRNAPPPFGCAAGGGNVCALDGLKVITIAPDQAAPNTIQPGTETAFGQFNPGYENLISWAPHPNPPGLSFPPVCVSPFLAGREPTSVDVRALNNLLAPGTPFPLISAGLPPTGLLTLEQNQFFVGPSFGQTDPLLCQAYQVGQQLGHFLYVIDRPRSEVVVFNSNSMRVIDRIPVPDPVSMAVAPNIDLLAVANQLADTVSIIDINPASARFHEVIDEIVVGDSPRGLAFEPTNEDLLVCNELDSSLSIIALTNLLVRRTVDTTLGRPFELAVTPRMTSFAFERNVYFSYLLDRNGACAVFESGPNGVNGWGFDDVIGTLPYQFQAPRAIQIDPRRLRASVYIAHEGPIDLSSGSPGSLGEGALSRLRLEDADTGEIPLSQSPGTGPNFRDLVFTVASSLGQGNGGLSGIPVDLAFDNQRNLGGLGGPSSAFSAGVPLPGNNKSTVRIDTPFGDVARNTSEASFLFAAVPEPVGSAGVIDVFAINSLATPPFDVNPYLDGVQSIPAPGAAVLCDYFRQ